MALLPEAIDFTAGQTLDKRVAPGGRMYRRISGYDNSEGPLTPDYFPDRVSEATALTGIMPEQVILAFRDSSGLRFIVRDADSKIRVMGTDGVWGSAGPVFDVIKDATPFKIGTLGVFPTLNGLWSYEPDSPTRKYRPFSLKSPRNYDKDYQITVTPTVTQELEMMDLVAAAGDVWTKVGSQAWSDSCIVYLGADTVLLHMGWGGVDTDIPASSALFNINMPTTCIQAIASSPTAGGTGYSAGDILTITTGGTGGRAHVAAVSAGVVTEVTLAAGGTGYTTGAGKVTSVSPSGGTGCTVNISTVGGVSFSGKDFLMLDMSMAYDKLDPTTRIVQSGQFINAPILASGLEIVFYDTVNGGGSEICRHAIPQAEPDGKVHRMAIHLGDMNSTTVKSIRIITASYWKGPVEGTSYELRFYSEDYDESWEIKTNVLMPAVKFSHSPWCNTLPRSPGDKATTGIAYPTSAIVLETFPENMVNFTPDHPRVKWNYIHRARSYLSTGKFDQQLSNPSLDSTEYFADPWRLYQLDVSFPTNADSEDVLDDYANYVTHGIFYRELYTGLGLDDIVLKLGVWAGGEYAAKSIIKSAVVCTMVNSGDKITSTAHGLSLNDLVEFSATTGGVVVGTHYYVRSIADADTFQISATRGGAAFTLNADGANTWTTAALSRDDLGRIDYPVTMDDSDNDLVDAAVHRVRVGDIITFGLSVGGVKKTTSYYVINTKQLDHFQVSLTPGGSAVDITADIANTWSHVGKVLAIGEHIIPEQIELNHDFAGAAKYAVVADDRVYLGHLTHTGYAVTCTMNDSGDTVTCTSHGLGINDRITFTGTTGGVTVGTTYYVVTVADDDTFQFSATLGGSAFTITADGANSWTGEWTQPLHMRVSNTAGYSSFPTTPRTSTDRVLARSYLAVDGQELGKFNPDAYEIRGLLAKNEVKFVFTEESFGELVGKDAATPWVPLQRDIIGLKSAKTLADCRSQIFWHGPSGGTDKGSYFHSYAGGLAVPISKGIVDSSFIDWNEAHQGVFSNERYVFFCYYDDPDEETAWCLWVYNLTKPGWRSTHSEAYEFAGMCVDKSTGDVYALTHDGDLVNVFGQLDIYGDDEAVRTVEWQHMLIAGPDETRTTSHVVADIITSEDSIEMELTVSRQGPEDETLDMQLQTITSGETQYRWPIGVTGDAVKVKLVYRGATPPEIHDLRLDVNPTMTA